MNSSYRRRRGGRGVPQRALRPHAEKGAAAAPRRAVQVRARRRRLVGVEAVSVGLLGRSVGLLQAEERSSLSASGELQSLATGRLLKKDRWSDAFLPRKTAIVYVRFVCPPVRKLGIRIRKFQLVYLVHSILGKSYVSMPIIMSIVQAGSNLCFYGTSIASPRRSAGSYISLIIS